MSSSARIAELNDLVRTTFLHGKVVYTVGIAALPEEIQAAIMGSVQTFDEFTTDNDPHGEHDFGAFDMDGAGKTFWKIDYYNPSLEGLSSNPADPSCTERVLTICWQTSGKCQPPGRP